MTMRILRLMQNRAAHVVHTVLFSLCLLFFEVIDNQAMRHDDIKMVLNIENGFYPGNTALL